jgi:hypothetical protein
MNLLEKLKQGTAIYKDVEIPGSPGDFIRVKLLSEDDELQASLAADKIYDGHKVGFENIRMYDAEVETQMLYRSLKDPATGNGISKNINDFRTAFTPETKEYFITELDNLRKEFSPSLDKMSADEYDKLMEDLKKKPEETIGSVSNIDLAKKLILSLVRQLPS